MANRNSFSYSDRKRPDLSTGRLKQNFRKLNEQSTKNALRYINGDKLPFPFLFVLMPEIEALNLYDNLCARNIIALKTCAKKSDNQNLAVRVNKQLSEGSSTTHQALKWMFNTGVNWEADEDQDAYDAVLDAVAALLIGTYEDKTILPAVADLIFKRNRKGLFIHDLVWSFFQTIDPDSLRLIANHLTSAQRKDVEMACKLLHLQQPDEMGKSAAKRKLYKEYLSWLNENSPFLYLTGEHFQLTSDPEPLNVDLEAKYLCMKISPQNRKPLIPLTENEIKCLYHFREASGFEQEILSKYSRKTNVKDIHLWNQWMKKQLKEQIDIAKAGMEEVR